jgi:hypothetical protein
MLEDAAAIALYDNRAHQILDALLDQRRFRIAVYFKRGSAL